MCVFKCVYTLYVAAILVIEDVCMYVIVLTGGIAMQSARNLVNRVLNADKRAVFISHHSCCSYVPPCTLVITGRVTCVEFLLTDAETISYGIYTGCL